MYMQATSDGKQVHVVAQPRTIEEYISYSSDAYELVLWAGGKLKPYNLITMQYNWIIFPVNLQPGY